MEIITEHRYRHSVCFRATRSSAWNRALVSICTNVGHCIHGTGYSLATLRNTGCCHALHYTCQGLCAQSPAELQAHRRVSGGADSRCSQHEQHRQSEIEKGRDSDKGGIGILASLLYIHSKISTVRGCSFTSRGRAIPKQLTGLYGSTKDIFCVFFRSRTHI